MYDIDPMHEPPPGHDPWPWRAGVAVFLFSFLVADWLTDAGVTALVPCAFAGLVAGGVLKGARSGGPRDR